MARIKLSPFLSDIRGKLGTAVFQGGKSGLILRQKAFGSKKRTSGQQAVRQNMIAVKNEWSNLSSSDRLSWLSFASFYNKPHKNDMKKFLTGYELFLQINMLRLSGGLSVLKVTTFELFAPSIIDIAIELISGNQLLVQAGTDPEVTGGYVAIYLSRGVNVSTHIGESKLRLMGTFQLPMSNTDMTNLYISIFGTLIQPGQKIKAKLIVFAENSGWNNKAIISETLV